MLRGVFRLFAVERSIIQYIFSIILKFHHKYIAKKMFFCKNFLALFGEMRYNKFIGKTEYFFHNYPILIIEVRKMKKYITLIMAGGMLLAIAITNSFKFIRDGRKLDELRGSVLRLHILANSDTDEDQRLKLCVRDALLENSDEIFGNTDSLKEAEAAAEEKLPEIVEIAERTLRSQGCYNTVKAEITDMHFDDRVYGDITMPAGNYRALRIEIGEAEGHNWWCVMYPPLCIPAASEVEDNKSSEDEFFDEEELDIMYHPKKYRVRFALWDKIKEAFD